MQIFLALFRSTLDTLLDILQYMMFFRALISWFPGLSESSVGVFLYTVTEWLIIPVRALFDRCGWNNMMMIDVPFFVTFIILSIVGSIL